MRAWIRSGIDTICGDCGRLIVKSDPFQTIRVGKVKRLLKRCRDCASEQVPDNVAALPDKPEPPALRPFAEVNAERLAGFTQVGHIERPHWTERKE